MTGQWRIHSYGKKFLYNNFGALTFPALILDVRIVWLKGLSSTWGRETERETERNPGQNFHEDIFPYSINFYFSLFNFPIFRTCRRFSQLWNYFPRFSVLEIGLSQVRTHGEHFLNYKWVYGRIYNKIFLVYIHMHREVNQFIVDDKKLNWRGEKNFRHYLSSDPIGS